MYIYTVLLCPQCFLFTSPTAQTIGFWLETLYEHFATDKTPMPYHANPSLKNPAYTLAFCTYTDLHMLCSSYRYSISSSASCREPFSVWPNAITRQDKPVSGQAVSSFTVQCKLWAQSGSLTFGVSVSWQSSSQIGLDKINFFSTYFAFPFCSINLPILLFQFTHFAHSFTHFAFQKLLFCMLQWKYRHKWDWRQYGLKTLTLTLMHGLF